jgi:hypothetical protein
VGTGLHIVLQPGVAWLIASAHRLGPVICSRGFFDYDWPLLLLSIVVTIVTAIGWEEGPARTPLARLHLCAHLAGSGSLGIAAAAHCACAAIHRHNSARPLLTQTCAWCLTQGYDSLRHCCRQMLPQKNPEPTKTRSDIVLTLQRGCTPLTRPPHMCGRSQYSPQSPPCNPVKQNTAVLQPDPELLLQQHQRLLRPLLRFLAGASSCTALVAIL